jgi:hypothetical protein
VTVNSEYKSRFQWPLDSRLLDLESTNNRPKAASALIFSTHTTKNRITNLFNIVDLIYPTPLESAHSWLC